MVPTIAGPFEESKPKVELMGGWKQIEATRDHYTTPKGKRVPNIMLRVNGHGDDWKTTVIHAVADPVTGPRWNVVVFDRPGRKATSADFQENGRRKTRCRFLVDTGFGFIVCMFDRTVNAGMLRDMIADGDVYVTPAPKTVSKGPSEAAAETPSVQPGDLF